MRIILIIPCEGYTSLILMISMLARVNTAPRLTHDTSDRLHDHRQHLAELKSGVTGTLTYISPSIVEYFEQAPIIMERPHQTYLYPAENHKHMIARATELKKFLMETFQMLMRLLSVQVS